MPSISKYDEATAAAFNLLSMDTNYEKWSTRGTLPLLFVATEVHVFLPLLQLAKLPPCEQIPICSSRWIDFEWYTL